MIPRPTVASPRVLLLTVLALGCGTTSGQRAARFPSQAELFRLRQAPSPDRLALFKEGTADVAAWELVGPLPDAIEVVPQVDPSPFGRMLAQAAGARPGLVLTSTAMHCVARETGHFFLRNGALPTAALQRFIVGRCGASSAGVSFAHRAEEVPASVGESALLSRWRGPAEALLREHLQGGSQDAGLWFGRDKGRAVLMLAAGQRLVHLERAPMLPDQSGAITLRGELLVPAESVRALINKGRYGVSECVADPHIRLPRFALACTPSHGDASAWIEVRALTASRILARHVLSALVWPQGTAHRAYARPADTAPRMVHSQAALADELISALNGIRQEAGMAPLRLCGKQSETATQVAPHYFAAMGGLESETVADKVVLGLRAGWDVEGIVRYGQFTAGWVQRTDDANQLLAAAMERPSGREALLDPAVQQVAVGTLMAPQQKVLAAVVSTYAVFDEQQQKMAEDAQAVLERLSVLRGKKNLPPPFKLAGISEHAAAAAYRVQQGEQGPRAAFKQLMSQGAQVLGQDILGWYLEAGSVDEVSFPRELLSQPSVSVAVAVAHYRPRDEPWGRLAVMLLATDSAGTKSAEHPSARWKFLAER